MSSNQTPLLDMIRQIETLLLVIELLPSEHKVAFGRIFSESILCPVTSIDTTDGFQLSLMLTGVVAVARLGD